MRINVFNKELGGIMRQPKVFILYLVAVVLGLGVVSLGIMFSVEHCASKDALSSLTQLKQQNVNLQSRLNETEEARLRLENENKQLRSEINDLNELLSSKSGFSVGKEQPFESEEYQKLEKEYALLQDAYNELLTERFSDTEQARQGRRRELTPEQAESFMANARERTYEMLDSRIAQAKTDYEAGILSDIRDASVDLFDLQAKMRVVSDEEREQLRQAITEQRSALGELYSEYRSYQLKTLAEEFKIENVDKFVEQAQQLTQPFGFSRQMSQGGNPPQGNAPQEPFGR
jgi:hypothetical protein